MMYHSLPAVPITLLITFRMLTQLAKSWCDTGRKISNEYDL